MELKPLDIIIWKGLWYNPMTYFIYQRTSTLWTHGSIVSKDPGYQWEAIVGGVQKTPIAHYGNRERKVIRYIGELPDLEGWLEKQKGKKYEFKSYLGYITGVKTPYLDNPDEFVCIELASEMFTQNQINIWGCEKPTYIYPSYMLVNPSFEEVR